jgi:hypothetical protein
MMDDKRKRYVVAGVIVGAVGVGLAVLSRNTPREQWGPTLLRIAKDGLKVVKSRYGNSEMLGIVEKTLDRLQESGASLAKQVTEA